MRSPLLLCPLLLVAGCTGGGGAARPTLSPAASPSPGVVVAADRGHNGVDLFRIGLDRRAVRLQALAPPAGSNDAYSVSVSSGSRPDACVIWAQRDSTGAATSTELRCYPYGDRIGRRIPDPGRPDTHVALRADGAALAWLSSPTDPGVDSASEQELVTAEYDNGRVSDVRRRAVYAGGGCATYVAGVSFAGDRLLLECSDENDHPGGLYLQGPRPASPARKVPDETVVPDYNFITQVGSAEAGSALVIQGEYCEIECPDKEEPEPHRAVRVDLSTGRVLEVIATPAAGRSVTSVSGGPAGVLYVTGGSAGTRVYLRLPGEKHGVLVTGLPDDLGDDLLAQP